MDAPETVRVEVELEKPLADLAREAGLDLSDVLARAVKRALGSERPSSRARSVEGAEQLRREIRPEIEWYNDHVAQHGLFADEWRKF